MRPLPGFAVLAVLWLTCAAMGFAQSGSLEHAWDLAAAGQRTEAITFLQRLLTTDSTNAEAHLLLGSLLMEQGDASASIAQLKAGVALRPHSEEALNALGEAYKKFGDLPSARSAFEQALVFKPVYGIAHLNLGETLLGLNDSPGAAAQLDRALVLLGQSDDAADAHYLRAKIDAAESKPAEAVRHLEAAVKLRPGFAQAWSDLGQSRRALADDSGALVAYLRAVDLNPRDAVAQYRLGAQLLHDGKGEQAIAHLVAADRLNPDDQSTLNALQMALRQGGDTTAANRIKQRLANLLAERDRINQNRLNAVRINNDGAALEKAGNLSGALEKYRQAAELDPEHEGIQINYAVALLRLGRWTEGLERLHQLALKDPANAQLGSALKDALRQVPPAFEPSWRNDFAADSAN